jgi:hypothetical protein
MACTKSEVLVNISILSRIDADGFRPPKSSDDLSMVESRLLLDIQRVYFGRVENIRVRGGDIDLTEARVVYDILLTKRVIREAYPQPQSGSFPLKASVIDLFQTIRKVANGTVRRIEIRHGLPTFMEIEEAALEPDPAYL